jgi:hypothetical protein
VQSGKSGVWHCIVVRGNQCSRDESCSWAGKRVGVIGNGSSAIQIVPQMQPTAAKLVNYVRSATWISANYSSQFTKDGKNFPYSEEERKQFREKPEVLFKMRREIEHRYVIYDFSKFTLCPYHLASCTIIQI